MRDLTKNRSQLFAQGFQKICGGETMDKWTINGQIEFEKRMSGE